MIPRLWEDIAVASGEYFIEKLDERTPEQIRSKLQQTPPITGRDMCVCIGLLVTRIISPNKDKLQHHWKKTDEGATLPGCFGRFMTRDRFAHVARNLNFNSNYDPRAAVDRAWKLRPVIEALQRTFLAGYRPPPVMAFDEAMLPSRSSFNRMRLYINDKPHKYGTKQFMLCCSFTAYWFVKFEGCLGKASTVNGVTLRDERTGPVVEVRNLRAAFGNQPSQQMRLIVTDRFYTSIPLSMELLTMGYCSVGTVMTGRKGLAAQVKEPSRPKGRDRGTFTFAGSTTLWWDNRPVYLLFSGGTTVLDRIVRRAKSCLQDEVACPRLVKKYQTFIGRVNVHDRLRLQKYSLQLAVRFKNYYKSLLLGFVDLALVNAYIVYNHARNADDMPKISHFAGAASADKEPAKSVRCVPYPGIRVVFQTAARWDRFLAPQKSAPPLHPLVPTVPRTAWSYCRFCLRRLEERKVPLKRWARSNWSRRDGSHGAARHRYAMTRRRGVIKMKNGCGHNTPVYLCNKVKHSVNGQARTLRPTRGKRKLRVRATEDDEVADNKGTPQRRRVDTSTSNQ
ncbi:hypothetical protein PPTG_21336 [Phytophthora nicotianae INRA-310]|uniref:PiggyBac transposable element-derived protein domain-containing protein n=1 Tax=Phytophthora nicotianae (strain INRA-310) TaxID=761204 RepID=W2R7X5_PHYN3|nr:hypothetical protein PPTG_21336 [Phytophthora nicotianae INRA-310]ETN20630.1 hypothetical protein PPTG_21336 [Phytophthora nicotianae INRA-310]